MRHAALGDEVVDTAFAFGVPGVPVLHGGILDLGTVECHQFNHRRVQLVLVAHGGRAALEVADVAAFVGDDQRALKLAGVGFIDAKVGGQLHGAAHPFRDVDKGTVAEHRAVESGVKVVFARHHTAQVFLDQLGVIVHRL